MLFLRTLSGEEDCTWKYLFLYRKLLQKYSPMDISNYRELVLILYPCRTRETLEQIELEHMAFSKNKFTIEMLEEHMLVMLRSNTEPNFRLVSRN
jgi:hypothetical protein